MTAPLTDGTDDARARGRALAWPGVLLGFSLGGFFDGILLHQVLQWHHLLSNVDAVRDPRAQVLADGLFHVVMYVVALLALWLLWHRRVAGAQVGASSALYGFAAVGFGAWHLIDGIVSHWLLGIHRIKVDALEPLWWDLGWFVVFGIVPVLLGWRLLRRNSGGPSRTAALHLAMAAVIAGPLAAWPARSAPDDPVIVLFAPGVSAAQAFDALATVDARVLWVDRSGGLWAVSMADPRAAWRLVGAGALLVSRAPVSLGCFSWSRAPG